jgi:hypothetical protein
MGCNFVELHQTLAASMQALAQLEKEDCGNAGDVGECLKLRAASMSLERENIASVQQQLRICSLLVSIWRIDAFDRRASHCPRTRERC